MNSGRHLGDQNEMYGKREGIRRSREEMESKRPSFFWREGEMEWDLSNLCIDEAKREAVTRQTLKVPRPGTLNHEFPDPLYPRLEDVAAVKSIQTSESLFESSKPKVYASLPPRRSSFRRESSMHSRSTCSGRIGAFAENTPVDDRKKSAKPPPPRWVNQPSNHDFDYKSDSSDHDSVKGYSSRKSEPTWNNAQKQRDEVEVSPGNFMELRGSEETMAAVMSGQDKVVECISCQIQLRCVPDADYVLCPDCRVLTPIPQMTESTVSSWGQDEEDDVIMMSGSRSSGSGRRTKRVGGLGLGLKLEHDF